MKILLALLLFTSCVTNEIRQMPNKRERDRRFFLGCIKDLYNQGLSEKAAIEACEKILKDEG